MLGIVWGGILGLLLLAVLQHGGGWLVSQVWPGIEYPGVAALWIFVGLVFVLLVVSAIVVTFADRWIVEENSRRSDTE